MTVNLLKGKVFPPCVVHQLLSLRDKRVLPAGSIWSVVLGGGERGVEEVEVEVNVGRRWRWRRAGGGGGREEVRRWR